MRRTCGAIALIAFWAAPVFAQMQHQQTYIWDGEHPDIKGMSGIEVSNDGTEFTAVSDFGRIMIGSIIRKNGRITAMPVRHSREILARSGRKTIPSRGESDAEAVAILPNGEVVIGFERVQRIARFPDTFGPAKNIGDLANMSELVGNKGVEAVAADTNGTLFAIPENPEKGFHNVYSFSNGRWAPVLKIPLDGSYLVVGADIGPDGDLWILDRKFFPPFFGSRVRRVNLKHAKIETMWEGGLGQFDNLEGIAVWKDTLGTTRVTTVSDNNDKWYQQTQVVEFSLQH